MDARPDVKVSTELGMERSCVGFEYELLPIPCLRFTQKAFDEIMAELKHSIVKYLIMIYWVLWLVCFDVQVISSGA
jgi:hypothetical protein